MKFHTIILLVLILCIALSAARATVGGVPEGTDGTENGTGAESENIIETSPETTGSEPTPTETAAESQTERAPETVSDTLPAPTDAPEDSTGEPETAGTETTQGETATETAPKPLRVGISSCVSASKAKVYVDCVVKAGATAVVFPVISTSEEAADWLASVDALIMTGGGDIDASYYGEENGPYQGAIDAARDKSDFLLIEAALNADLPMLCICRGMQILNVMCGGSLYQDIVTDLGDSGIVHRDPAQKAWKVHEISIESGSKIAQILNCTETTVNSWHHQAIKDLGEGLVISARAADGIIEGIEMPGRTFVVGVQFHPEYHVRNGNLAFLPFFEFLIDQAK